MTHGRVFLLSLLNVGSGTARRGRDRPAHSHSSRSNVVDVECVEEAVIRVSPHAFDGCGDQDRDGAAVAIGGICGLAYRWRLPPSSSAWMPPRMSELDCYRNISQSRSEYPFPSSDTGYRCRATQTKCVWSHVYQPSTACSCAKRLTVSRAWSWTPAITWVGPGITLMA
jgi:hypothetical protein